MSDTPYATREKLKANLLALLCAIIKRELARPPHNDAYSARCPRCGSVRVAKRGHDATGKQRYSCSACQRSFTAATGSVFNSTNVPLDTWLSFARCCVDKRTLRDSAAQCSVSLKTAFYMRKRLNSAVGKYAAQVKRNLRSAK